MRGGPFVIAFAILLIGSGTADASRFYCAVDDEWMKLTVEGGFSDGEGRKLVSLRGVLALNRKEADEAAGYRLAPKLVTHSWTDADTLKLRFYGLYPGAKPVTARTMLDLSVTVSGRGTTGMKGLYEVTVGRIGRGQTAPSERREHSGDIFCKYR